MTRIVRILLLAGLVLAPSRGFSNVEAHKKFWADTLGGTVVRIGTDNREVIKISNVWIFFRMQAPTASSKGSTADHIGLSVPNVQATLDKVKANGFRVATAQESPASYNVQGDIARPGPGTALAFVFGPDDVKVELFEAKLDAQGIKPTQPLRHNDVLNINLAFITDPWGTNIELTEGLSTIR